MTMVKKQQMWAIVNIRVLLFANIILFATSSGIWKFAKIAKKKIIDGQLYF